MLVNGNPGNSISIEDRGLLYGDGLFETILCEKGSPILFMEHMQRLQFGCRKLNFSDPNTELIRSEALSVANGEDCLVKVVLTRGESARGYYYDASTVNYTRIIYRSNLPKVLQENWSNGIRLYLCKHRLAENRDLAGYKHLNRLDQVLARAEWNQEFAEGVTLSTRGHVIEGTMSNIFLQVNDQWITPKIDQCGVQGVMRDFICQHAAEFSIACQQKEVSLTELKHADAIFVCNSVIGVWPVIHFEGKDYPFSQSVKNLMQYLRQNVSYLYNV